MTVLTPLKSDFEVDATFHYREPIVLYNNKTSSAQIRNLLSIVFSLPMN